jgi:hypothetical protein
MTQLNVDGAQCEALFASELQRSDAPTAQSVTEAISRTVRRLGTRGCAGRMAQEFGDHPQAAAERMRWIRQLAAGTTTGRWRVDRRGELYLCRHCTNQPRAALSAQGWTIWPACDHALAPQTSEYSGAS